MIDELETDAPAEVGGIGEEGEENIDESGEDEDLDV